MKVEIPQEFTHQDFINKIYKIGIWHITELNIRTSNIEYLPYLPNLKILNAYNYIFFDIPNFPNLEELYIEFNYMLIHIPNFTKLKKLRCNINALKLSYNYDNLKELYIYGDRTCNDFTLFNFPNLEYLSLFSTNLKKIPFLKNLEKIFMIMNSEIIIIPLLPKLKQINSISCKKILIPEIESLEVICIYLQQQYCIMQNVPRNLKILHIGGELKLKFYRTNLKLFCSDKLTKNIQGRLYQNIYRMYELLIF